MPALENSGGERAGRLSRVQRPYVSRLPSPVSRFSQLISKPRLLPFRIPPRRHDDRLPQLPLRQPPGEHRGHFAIPHPVEPRRVRCHTRRQDPAYLLHQSVGEHRVDPLGDATLQRLPAQRELNVPRPHRPGLARVLLPPAESPPREECDLDGPPGPLPPAARESAVESGRPVGEPRRRQVRRPGTQPLAPRRVEGRLVEQPLRQRAYVQPGPTDDHGLAARVADLREPLRRVAGEAARAVALSRVDHVEAQVRHAGEQRAGRLRGADVEPPIHLPGIGGHDGDGLALGPRGDDRSLADRRGADDHGHQGKRRQLLPNRRSSSSFGSCTTVGRPCTSCAGSVAVRSRLTSSRISSGSSRWPALMAAWQAYVAAKRSNRFASAPNRPPARSPTSSPKQRAASKRGCGFGAVCTTTPSQDTPAPSPEPPAPSGAAAARGPSAARTASSTTFSTKNLSRKRTSSFDGWTLTSTASPGSSRNRISDGRSPGAMVER